MPIQEENINFVESQVMDDVPEGGGAATGTVIADGAMNNVFNDISDLDRAAGRFNLRKIFLAVRAVNNDLYGGAKSVITALPIDDAIGYTLFTTDDPFDTRADASDRVESYLYKAATWHGVLHENHIAGMSVINILQKVGTELPPIGKTLTLVQNEGQQDQIEQYVRVTDVTATTRTFTDQKGDYDRMVVTAYLSAPLQSDFTGHSASRIDAWNYDAAARIRDTTVADAQRYYGAQPLTVAASIGDKTVQAQSQFAQLVPSARSEKPVSNQTINPTVTQTLSAGTRDVEVAQQAHTWAKTITAANRSLSLVQTLLPIPAPGTLTISFMVQGNWYRLTDNGNGQIEGSDPSAGAGTVNYATGAVSVTLGALPDVGSSVIMIYASPVHYEQMAGDPDIDTTVEIRHSVGEAIKSGTLAITWIAGGVTKTATADATGQISGDATGYASQPIGRFWLNIAETPDPQTKIGIDYQRQDQQTTTLAVSAGTDVATTTLGQAIEPGSLELEWDTESIHKWSDENVTSYWTFDSSGSAWVDRQLNRVRNVTSQTKRTTRNHHVADADSGDGTGDLLQNGSIEYATGDITIDLLPGMSESTYDETGGAWIEAQSDSTVHKFTSGIVTAKYTPAGLTPAAISTEIPVPPLEFKITPRLRDILAVPGSVEFTWNGKTYQDRQGVMVTDIQANGSATPAGSIDYLSGQVSLDYYAGGSGAVSVNSLLGIYGEWQSTGASFRADAAPIVPQSLQVLATTREGDQISGTADQDGVIAGDRVSGSVNYQYGTAQIEFGEMVADSSLTAEDKSADWYDPADVDGSGNIWQPAFALPSTVRYNAVAYTFIPVDSDILGIDPVRLPSDGRVPIYHPGDVAMIMHPQETGPTTPADTGSGTFDVDLGRTRIAWVRVTDANGDKVTTGYTLDRANGIVSWADITGLATPVVIQHTVADLRLITDAQISGEITLARPLSHDFPADESVVASCLLHGDRRARVAGSWEETTWNGTWADNQVGDAPSASLNLIDFPITVNNEGCDTDRWIFRVTNASLNEWELISEKRGLVWTGTYSPGGTDVAPINPRTRTEQTDGSFTGGVPYMTIPGDANGGGWSTGNSVRINTVGAIVDMWIARSIAQSDPPAGDGVDGMEMYALGNIDNPVE